MRLTIFLVEHTFATVKTNTYRGLCQLIKGIAAGSPYSGADILSASFFKVFLRMSGRFTTSWTWRSLLALVIIIVTVAINGPSRIKCSGNKAPVSLRRLLSVMRSNFAAGLPWFHPGHSFHNSGPGTRDPFVLTSRSGSGL